jgi:hypothetical protein
MGRFSNQKAGLPKLFEEKAALQGGPEDKLFWD